MGSEPASTGPCHVVLSQAERFTAKWNPSQYGTFVHSRTRPSRDLADRISISPRRVIDLGCGPGNSTAICAERWPAASIVGMDSSPEMIAAARQSRPDLQWLVHDIGEWAQSESSDTFDLIFSCAALQWVDDDHASLFPKLLGKLSSGGVLGAHMPAYDALPNQIMREMGADKRWRKWFPEGQAREWRSHGLEYYYAALSSSAKWMELWATDYFQVMPDVPAIVEWYTSTGLRPYIASIDDSSEQQAFLDEYANRLSPHFAASSTGEVPFSFRRIFILAGA